MSIRRENAEWEREKIEFDYRIDIVCFVSATWSFFYFIVVTSGERGTKLPRANIISPKGREKKKKGNNHHQSMTFVRRIVSRAAARSVCNCRCVTLGSTPSAADVAKVRGIPVAQVDKLVKPVVSQWTQVDILGRKRLASIAATVGEKPLSQIEAEVAKAPPAAPITNGREIFSTTDFKTVEEVIVTYERAIHRARVAKAEFDVLELQSFHIKDDLKRGLSAFKQAYLDKEKARLEVVKKEMKVKKDIILAVGASNFTTAIFNDIVNILRIAGERQEHARVMALKVLEDMTLVEIAFDATTQLLLKNVAFGDGPFDDSSLLFSCVEYPERGEISVGSTLSLEAIADQALKTISNRHQTPLDEGRLIQQQDTYPMLQRSPE
jgi:hypothetical protein